MNTSLMDLLVDYKIPVNSICKTSNAFTEKNTEIKSNRNFESP